MPINGHIPHSHALYDIFQRLSSGHILSGQILAQMHHSFSYLDLYILPSRYAVVFFDLPPSSQSSHRATFGFHLRALLHDYIERLCMDGRLQISRLLGPWLGHLAGQWGSAGNDRVGSQGWESF